MYKKNKLQLLILLLVSLIILFSACAEKRPIVVASYEALGTSIVTLGKTAKLLCEEGKISNDNCSIIKQTYEDVRNYYIDAGDLYKKVIETGSDEDVKKYQAHIQVIFEGLKKIEKYLNEKEE